MQSLEISVKLHTDPDSIKNNSKDYGNLGQEIPSAVLYPSSINDIISLIKFANNLSTPFTIAARGSGHSVRGQASARGGVVVDMKSLRMISGNAIKISRNPDSLGFYADVRGEQRWIDILFATLEHGLAPVSWTDYLHLTVGGTLSNGGISGQSFLHGPQISNVLEMDVITGKGELMTCSKQTNSELFYAVLGGLGQFGVITRARIVLEKAPSRAKWVRLIYSDFSKFTQDQEHLISIANGPNYVEGSLITNHSSPNNWRSSFYSPSHQSKIFSLSRHTQGLLYSLELVKYHDHDHDLDAVDQELESLLKELNYIPGFIFKKDVSFVDFLSRVGSIDSTQSTEEEKIEAHPWLNLFVPKSRVSDFNTGVLLNIIHRCNLISGPILFYPLSRKKWDDRMSAVTPDEDIFYALGLLHTSYMSNESEIFDKVNDEIMEFCEEGGIEVKQYLPHYKSRNDWIKHFGPKWSVFQEMKMKFDPNMILSPGQRIFNLV
ncbi:cytokinin dehydrogenase 3-like isoform X1 [Primulina eburnea]|uniref:cytokinin dehydrogenase 3-like isoform X1 n=1 Tax=Primulina eburnea TaxID=1245227 RepID=UPI003C6C0A84